VSIASGDFFTDHCSVCGVLIEVRTPEQNGQLHALCTDLANQLNWPVQGGTKIGKVAWKRLLIAAWERAHGRPAEIYPSIDGHGFDVIYTRSSRLSREEMEGVLHFGNAFAAENLVVRTKSKRQLREEEEFAGAHQA
jgi:hypothetical protein